MNIKFISAHNKIKAKTILLNYNVLIPVLEGRHRIRRLIRGFMMKGEGLDTRQCRKRVGSKRDKSQIKESPVFNYVFHIRLSSGNIYSLRGIEIRFCILKAN